MTASVPPSRRFGARPDLPRGGRAAPRSRARAGWRVSSGAGRLSVALRAARGYLAGQSVTLAGGRRRGGSGACPDLPPCRGRMAGWEARSGVRRVIVCGDGRGA